MVHGQLESLGQECPDHQLKWSRAWTLSGGEGILSAPIYLGHDVEMIGADPARAARNLKVLELIRIPNQQPQRDVGRREAAWLILEEYASITGVVRFHRSHFERQRRGRRLAEHAAGHA